MKNLVKYLILLLFIVAIPARADGPARWVVKDSDTTLYLYGTIHVLNPDLKWQTAGMLADFDKAAHVIFELAPDQMTPQVMQPLMFGGGLFGPDDNLANHVSPEKYTKLVALLQNIQVPPDFTNKMKPWLAAIMLAQVSFLQEGFNAEIGVEKTLTARAQENNQSIGGLESAAEQLGYFANMPMEQQLKFLNISIDDIDKAGDQLNEMLAAWIIGDIVALNNLMHEGMKDIPEVYDVLLSGRNKNWISQIKVVMETPGTIFLAVGAAHMPGDDGVVNLLKEAGYEVQRVE